MDTGLSPFLAPSIFIDSDAPSVRAFAQRSIGDAVDPVERARRLYGAVRDSIIYDPYVDFTRADTFRASACLAAGRGFCIGKAALLAASARVVGIPARVGFADVRNHLATPRLIELMGTDEFIYHGYAALHLDGQWIKATPTFNLSLCERFGVKPLDFDGRSDALFHPFDSSGRRHMEYLRDRGQFADVPLETIQAAFRALYPGLMARAAEDRRGDFAAEAAAARGAR
jgi:transglutaminase-like putative cysteine protease